MADPDETRHEYGVELVSLVQAGAVDGMVWAVAHEAFSHLTPGVLKELCCNGNGCGVVVDVKAVLDRDAIEGQGLRYWSL